jgi:hypothetical protein
VSAGKLRHVVFLLVMGDQGDALGAAHDRSPADLNRFDKPSSAACRP